MLTEKLLEEERQHQYNDQNKALNGLVIHEGELYQQAIAGFDGQPPRVIPTNEVFDCIHHVHSKLEHAGCKRRHRCIHEQYYGISQEEVAWLLGKCQTCLLNCSNKSKGPLELINSNSIIERIQIDLVVMHLQANAQFKQILRIVDHFSTAI